MAFDPPQIVIFGTGPIVRPIESTDGLRGPVQVCVLEGRDLCEPEPLSALRVIRRIVVQILPVFEGPRALSELDSDGQALHCVWVFPDVPELEACIADQGIRREPAWSPGCNGKGSVFLESNGGSFRMPRGVQLWFGGGAVDKPWAVDVIQLLDYNLGHPDYFALDTLAPDARPILRPAHHVVVQPLAGALTIGGATVTTAGTLPEISLAQPSIVTVANTLYRTRVAL